MFCGIVLQQTCYSSYIEELDWTIPIDNNPKQIESMPTDSTIKILQLSDIHYDPLYKINSEVNCEEPTCCRDQQVSDTPLNSSRKAGYWGDYLCDMPWQAVVESFEHIQQTHKVRYNYYKDFIIIICIEIPNLILYTYI